MATLRIKVRYGDEVEVEAFVKPGALPNDESQIREEVARLGNALIIASQSPAGITALLMALAGTAVSSRARFMLAVFFLAFAARDGYSL